MAYPRHNVTIILEIASLCMALICGCVLGWAMFGPETYLVLTISGALFTAFLLITIALILDPDRIRANQSMSVLNLASATLEAMQEGFTSEAAQKVCEILLPSTSACAVAITDLGPEVAEGTAEKVAEVEAALKDGSLHVFDTSKFTVNGETVTTAPIDLTFYDYSTGTPVAVYQGDTEEAITDGYFSESTLRSAPYFSLRIDGITEDADPVA